MASNDNIYIDKYKGIPISNKKLSLTMQAITYIWHKFYEQQINRVDKNSHK